MVETLKELGELNKKAVKDGLLLINGLSFRKDYSQLLGKPLSSLEDRFYRYLGELSTNGYVSAHVLVDKFYFLEGYELEDNRAGVDALVSRIRKKMGETTIITKQDLGYLSRRTSIETKCRDAGN
ncbi:MAG: hypothetical protein UR17_C0001G0490 [Candidatus Woesebacteria bacterium GW2011_GWF1_31_35]|uniref:OmpR/PhoB-type domain-containing protein n=1 Tax=Candidatus Woesebacteria bacterium GW2011_GWC2_31_9 TaxID=1618586 RepID=A0A0G0BJL5_9BACT|nr:MAG: hypothetical protein UR17_C0001G0490 [Candidatus Woesebacteria bacterium GW2011_GWF1_31_35]KKP23040.1 MAG: hypothetical protein UR11_C0001G0014 [Candidatus Woesebacteria bacterium GW2011_GWC1_30_29]KKP25330.1 MAG: hypothetical protein UR13_C0009G0014 [Candidatus Woesebacteria bacterium GW2011_GWD1_31_12]KKP27282.1 MAG: hypothetical protein UR16_C0004G0014 [Candidatus Woesebacteria bacterium GW2011_GWB1_31_29]KKP30867.1 MAG: hypothetical protein UR20_C0049G0002 [Candidatus Woesebacteria 